MRARLENHTADRSDQRHTSLIDLKSAVLTIWCLIPIHPNLIYIAVLR